MQPETQTSAADLAPAQATEDGALLNHIAGEWLTGTGLDLIADIDPAHPTEPLMSVVRSGPAEAERALRAAADAQPAWNDTPPLARAEILRRAAELMRARADTIALAMTSEEGKPLAEARAEVQRTAELIDATAALVYQPNGELYASRRREQWLMTMRAPLGVVVAITPWNFPLLIPAWKITPALLAGNAVVFKPAELTPLTAAHLVEVLREAGLPPGVLNLVYGEGSRLGPELLRPPAVAVSFTGGTETGRVIAEAAVDHHMKFQLELGGNNPVLVLADADLDLAAREIVAGAISGTGQKCTATRRVFVERPVADDLLDRVRTVLAAVCLAPGADPACNVGPLVSERARADFEAAVEQVEAIADLERFGDLPDEGFFVAPALALGGDPDAEIFRNEIFGPLTALFAVEDLDEGIRRCNDTPFGLSASLFSGSLACATEFSRRVDAGMIHINSQTTGAEPHLPFGGAKLSSSYSREVGRHGLEFFSQVKTVYLEGT
jgi:acyl-CoA reductase-like NAD-dependent aldehyde dehydrogenase